MKCSRVQFPANLLPGLETGRLAAHVAQRPVLVTQEGQLNREALTRNIARAVMDLRRKELKQERQP